MPLPRGGLDRLEPSRHPGRRIEDNAERPLHRLELDAVEVDASPRRGEVDRGRRRIGRAAGQLREVEKLDRATLGPGEVVRHRIHRQRHRAGLGDERRIPAGDPLALRRPVDHVEDDDQRLPGGGGGGEEVADSGVVVFLLREDGNDHVAGVAHRLGAVPVLAERAVNVGGVDEDQPGRLAAGGILAPHEEIVPRGAAAEGVGVTRPGAGGEAGEQRRQVDRPGEPAWQAGHRAARPRRLRERPADLGADEDIRDEALAGVRAAADRRHHHRLARHLRPELAEQLPIPLRPLR